MNSAHNIPDDDLLAPLEADIQAGRIIVIDESSHFFRAIEDRFPILGSKIAWSQVPGTITCRIDKKNYSDSLLSFLDEIVRATQLSDNNQVIVLGDSAMDVALQMDITTLRNHLEEIVDMPQHTYIVPPDIRWCACYSMEGYMDFGFSLRGNQGAPSA